MTEVPTWTPPVPPLRLATRGQCYGGALWNDAEYEVTLTAEEPGRFVLRLLDTGGHEVFTQELTPQQGERVRAAVLSHGTAAQPYASGVPGLEQHVLWCLGQEQSDDVRLGGGEVTEIAEWFTYALGHAAWDWAESPDWEY